MMLLDTPLPLTGLALALVLSLAGCNEKGADAATPVAAQPPAITVQAGDASVEMRGDGVVVRAGNASASITHSQSN